MGKKSVILMLGIQAVLETMSEQIKIARLRRKISAESVVERAGISRATLWAVEIIENLLYQGLYILVDSPKVGRLRLCLWLCPQIIKGEEVWGKNVLQGDILYLCLEATYHRLKSRISKITNNLSADAHFVIEVRGYTKRLIGANRNFYAELSRYLRCAC